MKIKYIKQNDNYSCGPIALSNVMIWSGEKVTKKYLFELCGGKKNIRKEGTDVGTFHAALFLLSILRNFKIVDIGYKSRLKQLDKHIDSGGIIVILYLLSEWSHYSVIVGRNTKEYFVVNAFEGKVISKISRSYMRKMLDKDYFFLGDFKCSVQWYIEKKEENDE